MLQDPRTGRWEVGVHEKALAALESLLFAKYQMFRNVYWHHAVRAATVLYKRIVEQAVRAGLLRPEELVGPTDEQLLHDLEQRARAAEPGSSARRIVDWIEALRERRLPKRALELNASDLQGLELPEWAEGPSPRRREAEDALAAELGLEPGEVFVDFPVKRSMFQLDVLVELRDGRVERMGAEGLPGLLDLGRVTGALYDTARVLRIYTFQRRELGADRALELLAQP